MRGTGDKAIFYRCFAVLFSSGIHIGECLSALATQCESKELRQALIHIQAQVLRGSSLSYSVSRQAPFSKFEIECLAAGEKSGFLHLTLESLADHWEQKNRLQHLLRQQLVYPIFVCLLALVAVAALPSLLQRSLQPLFEQAGANMPWISLLLSRTVALLGHPLTWVGAALALAALVTAWTRTSPDNRESALRSLPVLGPLADAWVRLSFLKTLHLTLRAGLPVLQGLRASGAATGSAWAAVAATRACARLEQGAGLSEALTGDLLPGWLAGFLRAGEEAGSLEALTQSAARILEEDLLTRVEQALSLIQPAVITFLGLMVAVVALGVLMPITKVLEAL